MDLLMRIKSLCVTHGTSIPKVEKACNFGNRAIYKWGTISPSIDKVVAVADYFGISIDELMGRSAPEISAADLQILDLFHQLNEDGQGAAVAMLQGLARQPGYIKSGQSGEMEA